MDDKLKAYRYFRGLILKYNYLGTKEAMLLAELKVGNNKKEYNLIYLRKIFLPLVCKYFNVSATDLLNKSRKGEYIKIRKYICVFLYGKKLINNIKLNHIAILLYGTSRRHDAVIYHSKDQMKRNLLISKEKNKYEKFEKYIRFHLVI